MKEYGNKIEETEIAFEPTLYSVYARPDENGRIVKVFSTCFEQPQDGDIFVKSGQGDEFVHVGYYSLYTEGFAHRYCVEGFDGIRECTEEEIAEMQANIPKAMTDKERIEQLEVQVADQTEMIADMLYEICQMEKGE